MRINEMPETPNGWTEWGRHVLSELERLNGCIEALNGRIRASEIEQTILKVKAGIWGALAGMIPVAITLLILFISGGLKMVSVPESKRLTDAEFQKIEKKIEMLKEENEKLRRQLDKIDVRTAKPPGQN